MYLDPLRVLVVARERPDLAEEVVGRRRGVDARLDPEEERDFSERINRRDSLKESTRREGPYIVCTSWHSQGSQG